MGIFQKKQEAIRKVVEETSYRPSVQAQTLRTKKTKIVGVVVPKVASASIGRVVEGILSVLNESVYQMLLAVTQNNPKKEVEYPAAFQERQVDGVILVATVFTAAHKRVLKELPVPVVIVGQYLSGYCCVFHDDYHVSYNLTKLFLEKGRRKLGYLSAIHKDKAVGAERYKGFCDAVRDSGLAELRENTVTAAFIVVSGCEKTGELLEKYDGLDGIICATDTMVAGAMQYLQEHHIDVPGTILVAGQGDSDVARVAAPPIITVHYSYEKSGVLAVQMLLELLQYEESITKEIKLGYHIVEL